MICSYFFGFVCNDFGNSLVSCESVTVSHSGTNVKPKAKYGSNFKHTF